MENLGDDCFNLLVPARDGKSLTQKMTLLESDCQYWRNEGCLGNVANIDWSFERPACAIDNENRWVDIAHDDQYHEWIASVEQDQSIYLLTVWL